MRQALAQAREGRLFILGKMLEAIDSRAHGAVAATRRAITKIQIPPDRIRDVIGPGGKMIRKIVDETKCTIDVEDDGTVLIGSTSAERAQQAIDMIRGLTTEVEVGGIYTGKVTRMMAFGAFVEILPGKEGLVHISELADYRVNRVEDVVNIGDEVKVLVTEIDRQGRINLSRRALLDPGRGRRGSRWRGCRRRRRGRRRRAATGTAGRAAPAARGRGGFGGGGRGSNGGGGTRGGFGGGRGPRPGGPPRGPGGRAAGVGAATAAAADTGGAGGPESWRLRRR